MADKKSNKSAEKKPSIFKKIGKFFHDYNVERKKIVWPSVKTTFKNFGVVLSSIITIAIFVGGLDYGLTALLSFVMKLA